LGTISRRSPLTTMNSRTYENSPLAAFPLVRGLFLLVWQVQDLNLRRLSRRFYSPSAIML
jgi:hypothetical protein